MLRVGFSTVTRRCYTADGARVNAATTRLRTVVLVERLVACLGDLVPQEGWTSKQKPSRLSIEHPPALRLSLGTKGAVRGGAKAGHGFESRPG